MTGACMSRLSMSPSADSVTEKRSVLGQPHRTPQDSSLYPVMPGSRERGDSSAAGAEAYAVSTGQGAVGGGPGCCAGSVAAEALQYGVLWLW